MSFVVRLLIVVSLGYVAFFGLLVLAGWWSLRRDERRDAELERRRKIQARSNVRVIRTRPFDFDRD